MLEERFLGMWGGYNRHPTRLVRKDGSSQCHPLVDAGACLVELRRFEEGESLLKDAYERLSTDKKANPAYLDHVLLSLIKLYSEWGQPEEAKKYKAIKK